MSISKVQGAVCAYCGHAEEITHWNDPGKLARVGSWMYIKLPAGTKVHEEGIPLSKLTKADRVAIAFRTRHLSEREGNMEYRLLDGSTVFGKFWWTHP
jgi:hypothetical protein